MSFLDVEGEDHVLEEEEIDELHFLSADILSFSKLHSSIQWKKSLILNSFMGLYLLDGGLMLLFLSKSNVFR
jgi:hypothetical protein